MDNRNTQWFLMQKDENGVEKLREVRKSLYTIGRDKNVDLLIRSSFITRRHANIYLVSHNMFVQDLNSCNGTFINGRKITPMMVEALHNSDKISFGLATRDQIQNAADRLLFFKVFSNPNIADEENPTTSDSELSVRTTDRHASSPRALPEASSSLLNSQLGTPLATSTKADLINNTILIGSSDEESQAGNSKSVFKVPATQLKTEPKEEIKSEDESTGEVEALLRAEVSRSEKALNTNTSDSHGVELNKSHPTKRKHSIESRDTSKKTRFSSSSEELNLENFKKRDKTKESRTVDKGKSVERSTSSMTSDDTQGSCSPVRRIRCASRIPLAGRRESLDSSGDITSFKSKQKSGDKNRSDTQNKRRHLEKTKESMQTDSPERKRCSSDYSENKKGSNDKKRSYGKSAKLKETKSKNKSECSENNKMSKETTISKDKELNCTKRKETGSNTKQTVSNDKKRRHSVDSNRNRERNIDGKQKDRTAPSKTTGKDMDGTSSLQKEPVEDAKESRSSSAMQKFSLPLEEENIDKVGELIVMEGDTTKAATSNVNSDNVGDPTSKLIIHSDQTVNRHLDVSPDNSMICLGFTKDKPTEVIEINSSDDEELFSSSQLMNFDKRPALYDPIKLEMEALMGPLGEHTEEDTPLGFEFDSTQQVCAILEDGIEPDPSPVVEAGPEVPLDVNTSKDELELIEIFSKPVENQEASNNETTSGQYRHKNRESTVDLPTHEADDLPTNTAENNTHKTANVDEEFSISSKSFFNITKPLPNWLTKKESSKPAPKVSKGPQPVFDKATKDNIKEERRKKLKDLAEQNAKDVPKEKKKGTAPKTLPESKTFRGGFLLEEGESSRPKRPSKSPLPRSRSKTPIARDPRTSSKDDLPTTKTPSTNTSDACLSKSKNETLKKCLTRRKSMTDIEGPIVRLTPIITSTKFTRSKSVCKESFMDEKVVSSYGLRPRSKTPNYSGEDRSRDRSSSPVNHDESVPRRRGRPSKQNSDPRFSRSRSVGAPKLPTVAPDPQLANPEEKFLSPMLLLNESCDTLNRYNFRHRIPSILPNQHSYSNNNQHTSNVYTGGNINMRDLIRNEEGDDVILSQSYNPSVMYGEDPNRRAERPVVSDVRKINVDDIILKMVQWQPNWFDDAESNFDITKSAKQKVPLYFENGLQYQETFEPLLLLEIWQNCYQCNRTNTDTPKVAQIEHWRVNSPLLYVDCINYVSDEDYKKNKFCKFEDLVLCEYAYKTPRPDGTFQKTVSFMLAYVSRVNRKRIRDCDTIKTRLARHCHSLDWIFEYTLTICYRPGKEPIGHSKVVLKSLMNVSSFLKMIRVIRLLRRSSLCSKILKPRISHYKVSVTQNQLVCPLAGERLNEEQLQAVLEGASLGTGSRPGIYGIMGPPGTGKSTVIVNLVFQILFGHGSREVDLRNNVRGPRILLVAPSNTAVDNVMLKLIEAKNKLPTNFTKQDIKQIRIGPENSINPHLQKYSLNSLVEDTLLQPLKNDSKYHQAQRANKIPQYLRSVLGQRFEAEYRRQQDVIITRSNVVCTTLNSCVTQRIADLVHRNMLQFTCCIIDEATQCHEVESLLPLLLGVEKFVLVGDPKQLHATVLHLESQKLNFNQSLFLRIASNFSNDPRTPIRMLRTQYRMHEEICQFPNKMFYEGRLRSEPRAAHKIPSNIRPYLVFNITKRTNESTDPYVNIDEVHLIKMMLSTLFEMIDLSYVYTVGIIAPYNNQKNLINKSIADLRLNQNIRIVVNTVDSFQGMENDIVIISCVREQSNSFVQNVNRLNVALTRAKQALYIIGNYALFKDCKTLYDLREDAKRRKVLLDIKQDPTTIANFKSYILKR